MNKNMNRFSHSFTLIEVLVSISIFFLFIATPFGFFTTSLKSQKKALASQELIDNTSYALEYISRALRMAKKDLSGSCIARNLNYQVSREGRGIKFKNYQDNCQEFFIDQNGILKENKDGSENYLISSNLKADSFNVRLNGQAADDNTQPSVTIFLDIKGKAVSFDMQPEIKIQTTVSQRNPDVLY